MSSLDRAVVSSLHRAVVSTISRAVMGTIHRAVMSTLTAPACRDRDGRDRDPRGTTALFQLELYRHKEWHSKNLQSRVCMHSRQYVSAPAPPRVAPSGLRGVGCRACVVVVPGAASRSRSGL